MKKIKGTESAFFSEEGGCIAYKDPGGSMLVSNTVGKDEFEKTNEKVDKILSKMEEVKNPTQYIFVNDYLDMSPGKVAAQVAHAQEELLSIILRSSEKTEKYKKFINQNPRTVIILRAADTQELYAINSYLESCGIVTGIYVDEVNNYKIGGRCLFQPTAIATEFVDKTDERVELIFKNFELYRGEEPKVCEEMKDIYWRYRDSIFGAQKILRELGKIYRKYTNKNIGSL